MDNSTRQLERDAAAGDGLAQAAMEASQRRTGDDIWSHLRGQRCLLIGVRLHYRGTLLDVVQWGGQAYSLWHPLHELDSIYDGDESTYGNPSGGGPRRTSVGAPGVVPLAGCLDLTLQPDSWPAL